MIRKAYEAWSSTRAVSGCSSFVAARDAPTAEQLRSSSVCGQFTGLGESPCCNTCTASPTAKRPSCWCSKCCPNGIAFPLCR